MYTLPKLRKLLVNSKMWLSLFADFNENIMFFISWISSRNSQFSPIFHYGKALAGFDMLIKLIKENQSISFWTQWLQGSQQQ